VHLPGEAVDWPRMGLQLFIIGPGAGVAVGLLGVATLDLVRRRIGIRRDYESLYSLGIAFAAFAAAEAVHGSGFLAAFAAGMTISVFDVELCDCFQEYGETTAEMTLLFTFVLLGSSLIWTGFAGAGLREALFAVAVVVIRPIVFLVSLWPTRLDRQSLRLISWFGPRGLSSLLLVLVTVFAGMPGSDRLFALCSLVVLLSVVLHGGSVMLLQKRDRNEPPPPRPAVAEAPEERPSEPAAAPDVPEKVDVPGMLRLQSAGEPVIVLDVRTDRSRDTSGQIAAGTVRLDPERAVEEAERLQLPREAWLVAFCA